MTPVKQIKVICRRDGDVIAEYFFGYAQAIEPGPLPERNELIGEAKVNLTNERIARPPYDNVTFDVHY